MPADAPDVDAVSKWLPLEVGVRKQPNGAVLRSRPLGKAELVEFAAEVWHRAFLRSGFADVPLDSVPIEMLPIHTKGTAGPLTGFTINTVNPAGRKFRIDFTKRAVGQTALQLVQE